MRLVFFFFFALMREIVRVLNKHDLAGVERGIRRLQDPDNDKDHNKKFKPLSQPRAQ